MRFCIIGTGRCGSTLLQKMMNCHPDLFVYQETHWIPEMHKRFGTDKVDSNELIQIAKLTHHVDGKPTFDFKEKYFSTLQDQTTIREFCDHIGTQIALDENKKYWADKTPDYGYYIERIHTIWPECKFIHIVRYPPHVIKSMSKHPGYKALNYLNQLHWCEISYNFPGIFNKIPATDISQFLALWFERLQATKRASEKIPATNYLEIQYETLLDDPNHLLRKIAQYIGVTSEEEWLSQASFLVDKSRAKKLTPDNSLKLFTPEYQALANSIGYSL